MAQLLSQRIPATNTISVLGNKATNEVSKLIAKLYALFSQSGLVKMSFEQFSRLVQSLLQTFETTRTKVTKRISRWAFSSTVYNQLMELWLLQNLPFVSQIKPYENFVSAFHSLNKKNQVQEDLIRTFYDMASTEWQSLQNPTVQELFNSLLRAVANVTNKQLGYEDQVFSKILYGNLQSMIEDLADFSNQTRFINNVWDELDETHRQKGQEFVQEAAKEYYNTAKRFILVNHPSRINERNLLAFFADLLQDRALACSDATLGFVERNIDNLMKFINLGYSGPKEASSLIQKSERILRKVFVLGLFPVKYSSEIALKFKDKEAYIAADRYMHLTEKLENAIYYSIWGYDILKTKAVYPVYDYVALTADKTQTFFTVTLRGLNTDLVKKGIAHLRKQFEILNRSRVVVQEKAIKLIFDRHAIKELGARLRAEVLKLYQKLREFEAEKIKITGTQYYKWLLNKYKPRSIKQEKNIELVERTTVVVTTHIQEETRNQQVEEERKEEPQVEEEIPLYQNKESEVEQASTEDSTLRQEEVHNEQESSNERDISEEQPVFDNEPTSHPEEVEIEPKLAEQSEENNQNVSNVKEETQKKKKSKGKKKH